MMEDEFEGIPVNDEPNGCPGDIGGWGCDECPGREECLDILATHCDGIITTR